MKNNPLFTVLGRSKDIYGAIFGMILSTATMAENFEKWQQSMQCGEINYKIESICARSREIDTLNECKSQSLVIAMNKVARKIELPDFHNALKSELKGAEREPEELFVTKWGCARIDRENVALFYYSIGGGSGEYSEVWTAYDSTGRLLEEKEPKFSKAIRVPLSKMKSVRSIMPE